MPRLEMRLTEDTGEVELILQEGAEPLRLPTHAVDKLIAGLAELRAQMVPAVPEDVPVRQSMSALADPRWYSEVEPLSGGHLFTYRDPGLGWRAIVLSSYSGLKLRDLLGNQTDALAEILRRPKN